MGKVAMGSRFVYILRSKTDKGFKERVSTLSYNPTTDDQLVEVILDAIKDVPRFYDIVVHDTQYKEGKEPVAYAVSPAASVDSRVQADINHPRWGRTICKPSVGGLASCYIDDIYYSEVFLNQLEMWRRRKQSTDEPSVLRSR